MKIKQPTYYFIVIFFSILFSAKSCEDGTGDDSTEIQDLVERTEKSLMSDSPDSLSLHAFEEKAKQKLQEFGELLVFMEDDKLDVSMRLRASEQLEELFLNDQISIDIFPEPGNVLECKVMELYGILQAQSNPNLPFDMDSIEVVQPLTKQGPLEYRGRLQYKLKTTALSGNKGSDMDFIPFEADFYLIRAEKIFGNTRKQVWQVFLGEIRAQELN